MISFESKIEFEQQEGKSSKKNLYLSYIRSLATSGNFFDLIKFIEETIPNVSISFY